MEDETIYFSENIVNYYSKFDARNLIFVKYLNLRHSSITEVDARYLLMLVYIDIAFSKVKQANLICCNFLETVIADNSQKVDA